MAEEVDALGTDRLDQSRHQCDQQQAAAQDHDVAIRDKGRYQKMAAPSGNPVQENDGHGIFEHRECERAEKHHRREKHPADDTAMVQEEGELRDDGRGLPRDKPFEIPPYRGEERPLVDDRGERDQHERQQRYDGEQRVVGNRTGEQQRLIRAEGAQDAQRKRNGVFHHVDDPSSGSSHQLAPLAGTATRIGPERSEEAIPNAFVAIPNRFRIFTLYGTGFPASLTQRVCACGRNRSKNPWTCKSLGRADSRKDRRHCARLCARATSGDTISKSGT
jgi:hypothetical protein